MTFTTTTQPTHDRAEAARMADTPWRRSTIPGHLNSQRRHKQWEDSGRWSPAKVARYATIRRICERLREEAAEETPP